MPVITMAVGKEPKHGNDLKAKIFNFLTKLGENDTSPGLHIEPINGSADPRARTGRVDLNFRAVLFRIDPPDGAVHYVYTGTWPHDEGTEKAKTSTLHINHVNGVLELRDAVPAVSPPATAPVEDGTPTSTKRKPLLGELGYDRGVLTEDFGFEPSVADAAFTITGEDELLAFAERLGTPWQQEVLMSMTTRESVDSIKSRLHLDELVTVAPDADEATKVIEALKHPASRMQFTYIGDDVEELRRVIEDGDFGAWRVFLHPQQREYVEKDYNGAFRLSGGAGTGKTVVLLHRARRLAAANASARVILTTFTRALADNLRRDLERLDPSIRFATKLGQPGILVRGVDQLAVEVRSLAGDGFAQSSIAVLGSAREPSASPAEPDWKSAIAQAGKDLPVALQSEPFFADEYKLIVLPHGITDAEGYYLARRPGRGVALDRAKRAAVWAVMEQMRRDQRISATIGFGDIAAVAAQWLMDSGTTFADHVLVDEGQDLEPAKWRLLRALVAPGQNDLFLADDAHQRIYGKPIVLKRYGIDIVGRSRRLRLNYRTTLENLRYALGVLSGVPYEDEDGVLTTEGYRSARSGPTPVGIGTASDSEQIDRIVEELNRWQDEGVRAETIAILASSNAAAKKLQQALGQRGVSVALITEPRVTGGQPVVMTMHTAKGMEFARVIMFDVSDGSFPNKYAYVGVPEEDRADVDRQFRSLLYVAASRARDELIVLWKGAPSALLLP